ncbi:GNAT family N-acetyltransferase [Nakamurella leprariae]|uniref:N-acetyltransferase n=1 Tax=Nakamurella leprariae TaxID=2803911 RepID=A0A938YIW3_9ACTN|nr:GNAT family N-acetyltransferase [Nakamurella leprariae]MBM9468605.1 N-acetyltransferase [Nakamurella leprariae]
MPDSSTGPAPQSDAGSNGDVQVVDNPAERRFEVHVDGRVAGFVTYEWQGAGDAGVLVLPHTEIDPAFEGRGLGSILARGALQAARDAGASVVPLCPFIRRYLERHPEEQDLVPADQRERFGLPTG